MEPADLLALPLSEALERMRGQGLAVRVVPDAPPRVEVPAWPFPPDGWRVARVRPEAEVWELVAVNPGFGEQAGRRPQGRPTGGGAA